MTLVYEESTVAQSPLRGHVIEESTAVRVVYVGSALAEAERELGYAIPIENVEDDEVAYLREVNEVNSELWRRHRDLPPIDD